MNQNFSSLYEGLIKVKKNLDLHKEKLISHIFLNFE